MARFTKAPRDWKVESSEIIPIRPDGMIGARVLLTVLVLPDGQVAIWPDTESLSGIDTEDVARLTECVRFTLARLVRPQG